ncbi:hypothetical protein OSB04_014693 [Centaurea solstitialis]|uniref:Late embryogenesis abundant protein LEA-2 subgroup domain-containing protein n=1 Tax=Centaurea solstitialis TaxID=347529 RepID=A0AA38SXR6_9ASTR|nr:hypothetical protein OSB04_014693 [Centaurea solstitialis]
MADPESQTPACRPAGVKSYEQLFSSTTSRKLAKQKHDEKMFFYAANVLLVVILLCTFSVIIGAIFEVNNPKLRLSSTSIQNLQYDWNSTSLNITISEKVIVHNEDNYGPYVFEDCTAVAMYGNSTIGRGEISGGRVEAMSNKSINVVMRLRSEGLNFSEVMEIRSYAKMTGRVKKTVDRRKTIEMNCMMNLNLNRSSITDLLCR